MTPSPHPRDVAVGIDVAARRGCDVVTLSSDLVARPAGVARGDDEVRALLAVLRPVIVAIDAPRCWAMDGARSRPGERELARLGIRVFCTPDRDRGHGHPFYRWMETGFLIYEAAAGYETVEVFPHATAVGLLGAAPPDGTMCSATAKRAWRRGALERAGVDTSLLHSIDEIDAALAAYTGWLHLRGDAVTLGGELVVPSSLPARAHLMRGGDASVGISTPLRRAGGP